MKILKRKIINFAGRKVELVLAKLPSRVFRNVGTAFNPKYKHITTGYYERIFVRNIRCKKCGKAKCGHFKK